MSNKRTIQDGIVDIAVMVTDKNVILSVLEPISGVYNTYIAELA